MLAIRGYGSLIARELVGIIDDEYCTIKRGEMPIPSAERYVFTQGILIGKKRIEQTSLEIASTYRVNYSTVCTMCEYILENNPNARICVVGSESGIVGSYDEIYADSKFLLHYYIMTRKIKDTQQLVCVAPSIIEDCRMTIERVDRANLDKIRKEHPKRRFLTALEVAKMIKFVLYEDLGYTTGTVIRMNGGKN